jgi:hypothetical protein
MMDDKRSKPERQSLGRKKSRLPPLVSACFFVIP